jgi:hypothetical protein
VKQFEIVKLAVVAALMLGAAQGVNACEFTWDEKWKIWRGDCSLTVGNGPSIRQDIMIDRVRLKMPDLVVDRFSFFLIGNSLEVTAYVENVGTQTARATTIALNVTLVDPANPMAATTTPIGPVNVPSLAASARLGVFVGSVSVDRTHDVDVTTAGMVDPPTAAQPVRGVVIESTESNNGLVHTCRVFGPAGPGGPFPGC